MGGEIENKVNSVKLLLQLPTEPELKFDYKKKCLLGNLKKNNICWDHESVCGPPHQKMGEVCLHPYEFGKFDAPPHLDVFGIIPFTIN